MKEISGMGEPEYKDSKKGSKEISAYFSSRGFDDDSCLVEVLKSSKTSSEVSVSNLRGLGMGWPETKDR